MFSHSLADRPVTGSKIGHDFAQCIAIGWMDGANPTLGRLFRLRFGDRRPNDVQKVAPRIYLHSLDKFRQTQNPLPRTIVLVNHT